MSASLITQAQLVYPTTKKEPVIDNYHGIKVEDPYRWLEDDNSAATHEWVKKENDVTFGYLKTIPVREQVRKRLEQLWNYPKFSSPFKKGDFYYFYKNDGLQNQAVLYRQRGLNGKPEEFLNPNTLNQEGTTALGSTSFSKDGKYFTYTLAQAGSDWQKIYVMQTESKQLLTDKIEWVKFGSSDWNGEDGFYYSGYVKPVEKTALSDPNQFNKIFYHKLGTPQSDDKVIFEDKTHPLRYYGAGLTEDERFLVMSVSEGTDGSALYYKDMKDGAKKDFKVLVPGFSTNASVIDNNGARILVRTNDDAPNYKIVSIDPRHPEKDKWQTIVAEKPEALESVGTAEVISSCVISKMPLPKSTSTRMRDNWSARSNYRDGHRRRIRRI